jgi:hypothetical protein
MGHDTTKVLLGATRSSIKEVDNKTGVIEAGYLVRLKSDGTISKAKSDGNALGISLGRDLSGVGFTSICRKGLLVPVRLKSGFTTPTVGAQCSIDDTTAEAIAYTGSGDTYVNAVYATGMLTGIDEDGNNVNVALIDFPGGL